MQSVFSDVLSLAYQYADVISFLALAAVGLIIIYGMMGVINMAHGEFIMMGAYVTSYFYYRGVPFVLCVVLAGIAVGLAGIVIERLLVRRFYGQLLMSLVATWGLSLVLSQGFLLLFGPSMRTVPTPLGNFQYEGLGYSWYTIVRFLFAVALVVALWLLLKRTAWGTRARATMGKADMARALGIRTEQTYAVTFALGAGLAGVAGALLAATTEITPTLGANYTPLAFITVVVGGGVNPIAGLVTSVLSLGGVSAIVTYRASVLLGYVAMMITAIIMIRFMPEGFSQVLNTRRSRRLARAPGREVGRGDE